MNTPYNEMVYFPEHFDKSKCEIIISAARQVRAWAEANWANYQLSPCLTGMCAIASGRLWMVLRQKGIVARLMMAVERDVDCHVYAEVDGVLVDVTASQFGEEEIVVLDSYDRQEWYWKPYYVFSDVSALRKNQIDTQWLSEQVAIVFDDLQY